MNEPQPSRRKSDLAEMVEMLLDKGIVVNADVAVSVGETELLGVHVRAAIASFETAAKYGLEFPEGTDMQRVQDAADVQSATLPGEEGDAGRGEDAEEGEANDEEGAAEDEEADEPADDQTTLAEELEVSSGDDGD